MCNTLELITFAATAHASAIEHLSSIQHQATSLQLSTLAGSTGA